MQAYPTRHTRHNVVRKALQTIIFLVILIFAIRYLHQQWGRLSQEDFQINAGWLMMAVGLFVLGLNLLPIGSWMIIRYLGGGVPLRTIWQVFFLGQLAKYLPGGIWSLPGRMFLYNQRGLSREQSLETVFWETGLMVVGATIVAVAGLPLLLSFDYLPLVILLVGGFSAAFVGGTIGIMRYPHLIQQLPGSLKNLSLHLSVSNIFGLVLLYALLWFLIGGAMVALVLTFQVRLTIMESIQIAGLFAGAWATGFLFVLTPGGIGVRDALLAIGLSSVADDPTPLLVTVAARLCWTLAEIVGTLSSQFVSFKDTGYEADHSNSLL